MSLVRKLVPEGRTLALRNPMTREKEKGRK
jgi:hypothetical protein